MLHCRSCRWLAASPMMLAALLCGRVSFGQRRIVGDPSIGHDPSQQLLLGVEGGVTYARLLGGQNFGFRYVYPLGDLNVAMLRFNTLGDGWSGFGGLRLQVPLSKRFGLITGLEDVQLSTGAAQTIVRNAAPEISGPGMATVSESYQDQWRYTSVELLLRYTLAPHWLYAFAGGTAGVLTSDGFDATQQILSGGSFEQLPSGTPTGATYMQLKNYWSVQYYELVRGAVSFGLGSMLPVPVSVPLFGSLVFTPEVALHIPFTHLFTLKTRQIYASEGIVGPDLFYGSFGITLSTPLSDGGAPVAPPAADRSIAAPSPTPLAVRGGAVPPSARHEITVSGTVRDEASGVPIKASLTAIDLAHGARVAAISTDSLGHYIFMLALPGRYSITAESPDHLFHTIPLNLPSDTINAIQMAPLDLANEQGHTQLLISFGYNDAKLSAESYPELLRVVNLLATASDMKIEIEGHTSSEGSDEYNQTLSEERADAVRSFLVLHGITASRIAAVGYGKSRPLASNNTEEGRAQNRRVEMRVTN